MKVGFCPQVICGREDSVRAKHLSLQYPELIFARNVKELLEYDLDALVIALPAEIELMVIEKCIEKKIPTLIEKPVSVDPNVLRHLVNLNLNKVRVAYNRRFYSSVRSFKSGIANEPGLVHVTIPELSINKNSETKVKRRAVLENSVHIFDLLRFTFGKITLANVRPVLVGRIPVAINAELSFTQGSVGNLNILFNNPENVSIRYWGKSQNLELCPIEIYRSCSMMDLKEPTMQYPVKQYVKKIDNWRLSNEDQILKPGFFEQYSDFYKLVTEDNFQSDLANLDDALSSLEIGIQLVEVLGQF